MQIALYSRHGHNISDRAKRLVELAAALPVRRVLLDGELVAVDADGRPDFLALPSALSRVVGALRYFAFDILYLEGKDLRELPLEERQRRLAEVIADTSSGLLSRRGSPVYRVRAVGVAQPVPADIERRASLGLA